MSPFGPLSGEMQFVLICLIESIIDVRCGWGKSAVFMFVHMYVFCVYVWKLWRFVFYDFFLNHEFDEKRASVYRHNMLT